MASVVSICNLALANIGKDGIDTLAEPTPQARACNRFYEHVRDTLLQAYPWRFAEATLSMAEITNDKIGVWPYAYSRPNDCLKIRWVQPQYTDLSPPPDLLTGQQPGHPYGVEGGNIYCSLSPAFLTYTRRLPNPDLFPPLFVDTLAWHLAVALTMPLTRDPDLRKTHYQLALASRAMAEVADANEVRENSDHASELVAGRA